jgi:drug/metabolite transporter (DMT)-like permease
MQNNAAAPLFALAAFGLYATHDVVIKYLGGVYSPVQTIFFSTLMSFPLVTLMLIRDATPGTLIPVHPWWSALRMVAAVFAAFLAFYAFSVLPLAQTYVLLFAMPLIVTLLSIPILGEHVGPHRLGAVVVGLIGVVVVMRPGLEPLSLGHLAGLSAAFFSALTSTIVRKIGSAERTVVLMLYPMTGNLVVMGALLGWVYEPMPALHLGATALIALFGFVAGLLIIAAYRRADAAVIAPMQYSQILWASAYGLLFFDETLDAYTLAGAGLIIASGLYIVLREHRLGRGSTTPVLRSRSRGPTAVSFRSSPFLRRGKPDQ